MKRSIEKVATETRDARANVATLPNTVARQESLVGIYTAGAWFKAGGDAMNSNDAIIAMELQRYDQRLKDLTKQKSKALERQQQRKDWNSVMERFGDDGVLDPDDLTNADLKN